MRRSAGRTPPPAPARPPAPGNTPCAGTTSASAAEPADAKLSGARHRVVSGPTLTADQYRAISQAMTRPVAKSPSRYAAPHMKLVWTLCPWLTSHFRRWRATGPRPLSTPKLCSGGGFALLCIRSPSVLLILGRRARSPLDPWPRKPRRGSGAPFALMRSAVGRCVRPATLQRDLTAPGGNSGHSSTVFARFPGTGDRQTFQELPRLTKAPKTRQRQPSHFRTALTKGVSWHTSAPTSRGCWWGPRHSVVPRARFAEVVDGHDVGVLQLGGDLCLAQEPGTCLTPASREITLTATGRPSISSCASQTCPIPPAQSCRTNR